MLSTSIIFSFASGQNLKNFRSNEIQWSPFSLLCILWIIVYFMRLYTFEKYTANYFGAKFEVALGNSNFVPKITDCETPGELESNVWVTYGQRDNVKCRIKKILLFECQFWHYTLLIRCSKRCSLNPQFNWLTKNSSFYIIDFRLHIRLILGTFYTKVFSLVFN